MAITPFGPFIIPPPLIGMNTTAPSFASVATVNAAQVAVGMVFRVPKSGTLRKFEWRLSAVGNTPDNGIRCSFQNVSGGLPDGTRDQFRDITSGLTTNTWQVPGLITSDGTDSGSLRTVTAGERLAIVMENVSFTTSDSWIYQALTQNVSIFAQLGYAQNYVVARNSSGVWSVSTGAPPVALLYDDGTYAVIAPHWYPYLALNSAVYGNGSTPDERGLRFIPPVTARLTGVWIRGLLQNATDIVLYDGSSSVLASVTLDTDQDGENYWVPFPATTLTGGSTYRISVKPTSASTVTLYDFDVSTNALLACVEGGVDWYYTQRTDAGAWTDTNTKRPWIGAVFDGVDSSSGGVPVGYPIGG